MPDEPNPQPQQNPAPDPPPQDSSPQTPPAEDALQQPAEPAAAASETVPEASAAGETSAEAPAGESADQGGSLEDEWAAALSDQQASSDPQAAADAIAEAMAAGGGEAAAADSAGQGQPPAETFEPPQVEPPAASGGFGTLEVLDDVELDLSVELGRTELYIEDVLKLGSGSVIQLDKAAGDPVDIYVNQRLVARGEVLVLNDNFCVRINEIVSPVPELDDPTQ